MKNICFSSEDEAFRAENGIQLFHNREHSYIIYNIHTHTHTHKFRTTMNIRKKVLQVKALFAAAGAQAQNPIVKTIYTADPAHPINYKSKMNTASKSIFTLVFTIIFSLVSISTLSAQTVWLDQLDLSPATQSWGVPEKNRSVDGTTS